MEIKSILDKYKIVGVISNYLCKLDSNIRVRDLNINNINKALKIVGLDDSFLDKYIKELTMSELWKVDLAKKLDEDVIIIGNMSKSLIHKDREYMKKLFNKLSNNYNKKIIIIDNDVNSFIGIVKKILVINNKRIVYSTSDFYDDKLYDYVLMPKIVEFIKFVNKDNERVDKTLDIYELIKDIYRRIS